VPVAELHHNLAVGHPGSTSAGAAGGSTVPRAGAGQSAPDFVALGGE
jgi:hypothetical protein